MNILYIAYSCAPNSGSENQIGWKIPLEAAEKGNIFVITKEEHRIAIEAYCKAHKDHPVTYFFVDIPSIYKKVFKGPFYSGRLNIWHRRALPVAKKLCREQKMDIIHQITPVEFRSIGAYGKIPETAFVCGPLGGGEQTPVGLKTYMKGQPSEWIRSVLNRWYRLRYQWSRKLECCDCVMFANEETKAFLSRKIRNIPGGQVLSEIGADLTGIPPAKEKKCGCTFLVAGRMIPRKGHRFLLETLKRLPQNLNYRCRIVGAGPKEKELKAYVAKNGLSCHVEFVGKVTHEQMRMEYQKADVLIMPSLRETTGSVILEAMSQGVPVITVGRFGGAVLIDDNCGWLYDGQKREEYIQNLAGILKTCISDPERVSEKVAAARTAAERHTWRERAQQYFTLYHPLGIMPKE